MGYNLAKRKMKKLLLIALLIMAGSVIVGKTISQREPPKNIVEYNATLVQGKVDVEIKDQVDGRGTYLGTVIMVYNNLSSSVYVKVVFKENGKKQHVVKYVPARESRRAWYGNQTLEVVWDEVYWDYSPID